MEGTNWIEKQAKLYRNLALTGRYQAVVHLEDKEDETFWNYQLQTIKPGRYRYIYFSKHCCPEKFYHKVSCTTEPVSGTLTGTVG